MYNCDYIFNYRGNMENKNEKFIRLANSRVNKALKQLDLISNLSNKNIYSYSENEIKQIIIALNKKIKEIENKFHQEINNKQFKL